jgi:hypothetical protein
MRYADLELERATVEIRYARAYLLWDRAGLLWRTLEDKWPDLGSIEANPAKSVFRLDTDEASYELVVELDAARVIGHRPKPNLKEFSEIVSEFFRAVSNSLALCEFNRIGFRTISVFPTKTMEEATDITCGLALLRIPEDKTFGFERKEVAPEIVLHLKGEEVAARVKVAGERTVFEVTWPPGIREKPISRMEFRVVYDVDYYTLNRVDVAQIGFVEWIPNAYRLIKRDSDVFLKRTER